MCIFFRSNPETFDDIIEMVNQFGCFSPAELLYLTCSLDDAKFTEREFGKELFNSAAEEFICIGAVRVCNFLTKSDFCHLFCFLQDVRVFHCAEFWRCMRSTLKTKKYPIGETAKDGKSILKLDF